MVYGVFRLVSIGLMLGSIWVVFSPAEKASADCTPGYAVDDSYFGDLIAQINVEAQASNLAPTQIPYTNFTRDVFRTWKDAENTAACWNPLATTLVYGNSGPLSGNSAGVQNYPDRTTGIQATAITLVYTLNGNGQYYKPIRDMLAMASFDSPAIRQALDNWSGHGRYVPEVLSAWQGYWSSEGGINRSNVPTSSEAQPPLPVQPPSSGPLNCASAIGPGGVTPGNYPPQALTQEQKQWLYDFFGHGGQAPVGYGGEDCPAQSQSSQPSQQPQQPLQPPAQSQPLSSQLNCASAIGPGGITPGNYPPQNLTQDQRQWLYQFFGHSGQAPAGYGGEDCQSQIQSQPQVQPPQAPQPGQPAQPPPPPPLLPPPSANIICPSGVGPGGITAGSYPPQNLTQDQRQWLYQSFGHSGQAPVGYGGEGCQSQPSQPPPPPVLPQPQPPQQQQQPPPPPPPALPPCPPGVGPGGITAGSYPPQNLTQEQRQWLYQVFGHSGQAAVGYGGEGCQK